RYQASQAPRASRAHRAGKARPRGVHFSEARAAPAGLPVGARVRAVLERTHGSLGEAFRDCTEEEGEEAMTTRTRTMELTLTRTIPALPADVFDAWLDPKHPGNPWTDAKKLIFDPRVDGLFFFAHVSAAGTKHVRAEHDAALGLESGEEWAHYGRF